MTPSMISFPTQSVATGTNARAMRNAKIAVA
jgi:hypothetical protein